MNQLVWHLFFIITIIILLCLVWRQRTNEMLKFKLNKTNELNYDFNNYYINDNNFFETNETNNQRLNIYDYNLNNINDSKLIDYNEVFEGYK